MEGNIQKRAIIAGIAATVIWGFSFMATRVALEYTSAHILLSMRFTASFLVMFILAVIGIGRVDLKGKPLGLFLLMGLCEPVIYFIAETYGIKYTTSSFSGLMISLIPIATALLSVVIIHEHLSAKRFFWITWSVAGVALISVTQTSEGIVSVKGILYLLVAIIAASFFSILSRYISGSFSSFERTYIMMLMGCVAFTAQAVIAERSQFFSGVVSAVQDKYVILPVLFLSVISSVIAFFCTNYAMTYLDVNRVVAFTNITPVVSVLAGVLILGEAFSAIIAVGIILIISGVYMVNKIS